MWFRFKDEYYHRVSKNSYISYDKFGHETFDRNCPTVSILDDDILNMMATFPKNFTLFESEPKWEKKPIVWPRTFLSYCDAAYVALSKNGNYSCGNQSCLYLRDF